MNAPISTREPQNRNARSGLLAGRGMPDSDELPQDGRPTGRAANYLSVGRFISTDNPLLREPLTLAHVKPLVVGQLGYDARPKLHLCAFEQGHQEV